MKPRMMSKPAMDHLFHHILDGHKTSYQGIEDLRKMQLIDEQSYADLLRKNAERLIERINEFKIVHRLTCIFFALMFGYLQIAGEDLEMRRARRVRTRRRNETEQADLLT